MPASPRRPGSAASRGCILVLAIAALGCAASQTVTEQEAERRDAWVVTRLVVPRDVALGELRLRDVDTETFHSVGGRVGEPLILKVKAGRYRFKSLQAKLPNGKKPKFEQPEKALEFKGCCVNYIGDIVIASRRDDYALRIEARPDTVIAAASRYPEVFADRPVLLVLGDQRPRKLVFEEVDGAPLPGLEASSRPPAGAGAP